MKNAPLKIVFFGTPRFATLVLDELEKSGFLPAVVVARPDRTRGRGLSLSSPETKLWARERDIDTLQPEALDTAFINELKNTDWDIFIVASYGKKLPKTILNIPSHGTLNIHPSLLPKYRGASPIAAHILADDRKTGVTIMLMDEKMDHGPILAQASIEIDKKDWPPNASVLEEMLAVEGGTLLVETFPEWMAGNIKPEPQDHEKATYTQKIKKEDGKIDLGGNPYKNFLKIRAFDPWPGTYFLAARGGRHLRVKIADASWKDGELILERVVPEGRREMAYADFLRGNTNI